MLSSLSEVAPKNPKKQEGNNLMKKLGLILVLLVVCLAVFPQAIFAQEQSSFLSFGNHVLIDPIGLDHRAKEVFGVVGYDCQVYVEGTIGNLRWVDYGDGSPSEILQPGQMAIHRWTRSGKFRVRYYVLGGAFYRDKIPILDMSEGDLSLHGNEAVTFSGSSSRVIAATVENLRFEVDGGTPNDPGWVSVNGQIYLKLEHTGSVTIPWQLLYYYYYGSEKISIGVHAPSGGEASLEIGSLSVYSLEEGNWFLP